MNSKYIEIVCVIGIFLTTACCKADSHSRPSSDVHDQAGEVRHGIGGESTGGRTLAGGADSSGG
jgi:hypothetical protein